MATISHAIYNDHRELEQYYNEIVNSSGDHDHQKRCGNQFIWELARHSVGEELIVYPAMEKYLGARGRSITDSHRKEHYEVKKLLKDFHDMKATDDTYIEKLNEIWGPLSKQMMDEEESHMPALESKLQAMPGESELMARAFGRTKIFVPSRSHSSAGKHPSFETVTALLTAPIGHIADIFRQLPDRNHSDRSTSSLNVTTSA